MCSALNKERKKTTMAYVLKYQDLGIANHFFGRFFFCYISSFNRFLFIFHQTKNILTRDTFFIRSVGQVDKNELFSRL